MIVYGTKKTENCNLERNCIKSRETRLGLQGLSDALSAAACHCHWVTAQYIALVASDMPPLVSSTFIQSLFNCILLSCPFFTLVRPNLN